MNCNNNCLNCQFEQCKYDVAQNKAYQAAWRADNKEHFREIQARWRNEHRAEINLKRRVRHMATKRCGYCEAEFGSRTEVLRYRRYYFCDTQCLNKFLLKNVMENGEVYTIKVPKLESEN